MSEKSKERWLERILLAIIAAATIVTACEMRMIVRDGLSMEIVKVEGE